MTTTIKEICIAIKKPDCQEFVQWLKKQGYEAHIVIFGESSINNVWETRCDEVKAQLTKLWKDYQSQ